MLPKAAQALLPAGRRRAPGATTPNGPPASATRPSDTPDLKEMGQNTHQRIKPVQDAAVKQD